MTEEFDPKVYLQQGAWRDVRLGLHRTEELLERLGRPQDQPAHRACGRHERQGVDVRVHRGHSASGGLQGWPVHLAVCVCASMSAFR